MTPIGFVRSPFKEKFGIPRQPGLSRSIKATVVLEKEFSHLDIVRGLENYSHIWLIFSFHQSEGWSPTARPPRLGGNERMGLFATRSPYRPNQIGLSVVKLLEIKRENQQYHLLIEGPDILDHTPVLDIKPYLPEIEAISDARSPWKNDETQIEISFAQEVDDFLSSKPELKEKIIELLSLDPRPRYQTEPQEYGISFENMNIRWSAAGNMFQVIKIENFLK